MLFATKLYFKPVVFIVFFILFNSNQIITLHALSSDSGGVVVEKVKPESIGAIAGIQSGDLILSWTRLPNMPVHPREVKGEKNTVFDFLFFVREQSLRGVIKLAVNRDGTMMEFELLPGSLGITVRPRMPEKLLNEYKATIEFISQRDLERAEVLSKKLEKSKHTDLSCWLSYKIANVYAQQKQWSRAHLSYQAALNVAVERGDHVARSFLLSAIGRAFMNQSEYQKSYETFHLLRKLIESQWGDSISLAGTLYNQGTVALKQRDLSKAEEYLKDSLVIWEKYAPGSFKTAMTLNNLGDVMLKQGRLSSAEKYLKDSVDIKEKRAPGSMSLALTQLNLGMLMWKRGRLSSAEEYLKKSLVITEKSHPGTLTVAKILDNLGVVAWWRGELLLADEYYKTAQDIHEKQKPCSIDMASILNNRGLVALHRDDLSLAEEYCKKAQVINEKLRPESLEVAVGLLNLGLLKWKQNDLLSAEELLKKALAIQEKLAPDSLEMALTMNNLGAVASTRGDLTRAEVYNQKALAIDEKIAPGNFREANVLPHRLALFLRIKKPCLVGRAQCSFLTHKTIRLRVARHWSGCRGIYFASFNIRS